MYAMYSPTVQIPVRAKKAMGTLFLPNSAGIEMISEKTEKPDRALNETRSRLPRRQMTQPGIARSRENAYQVREALVSPAAPQNSWPTVAIRMTSFAAHGSSAVVKMNVE